MITLFLRPAMLACLVTLAATANTPACRASLQLNMTGGTVDCAGVRAGDITLFGETNGGELFVFTANFHDGITPVLSYFFAGESVSPRAVSSGGDWGSSATLSIGGEDIPIVGPGIHNLRGGNFEIVGPLVTVPNPFAGQSFFAQVQFEFNVNIYKVGNSHLDALPDFTIDAIGTGIVELLIAKEPDDLPLGDLFRVADANYLLVATVPEAASIIVWSLLGVSAVGVICRRRAEPFR